MMFRSPFAAFLAAFLFVLSASLFAQGDSVDVTFTYTPEPGQTWNNVYLPGEFNGWTINNNTRMSFDATSGRYVRTVRLRVGGPDPLPNPTGGIPGAYQYKFHADGNWFGDPLNPRQNPQDNNNSYLYITDPTVHLLLPNSTTASGIIRTRFPEVTAYLFPATGESVDTSTIAVTIDQTVYTGLGMGYDPSDHSFRFVPPAPLSDGLHTLAIAAGSSSGTSASDTTTFEVAADQAQILNLEAETRRNAWRIYGAFFNAAGNFDSTLAGAELVRSDSTWTVSVANGQIDTTISLLEGANEFTLRADTRESEPVTFTRIVNHSPDARVGIVQSGSSITFDASGSSDPDGQVLTFLWREDADNPESLGIDGQSGTTVSGSVPTAAGEYFLSLIAEDPDGNLDSMRAFFTVNEGSADIDVAGLADIPQWAREARIYLMFIKAFTPAGTFQEAIANLDYVEALGCNVIWVLPVMDVPGVIDNQINIGYNIIDFFNVDSRYGSNQDFRDFVDAVHARDMRVILDVTPNHSGRDNPLAIEARQERRFSPYYNYYQTRNITHNDNGLGICQTGEGIYFYCGFSDALLNWAWDDVDAQHYMIEVYKHWIREYDIDGFRFDVYWGPHRRYGRADFDVPMREELKKLKPDILLLGEDDGTGVGTEVIYADQGGGVDLGYDFKLYFNQIRDFGFSATAVTNLHNELNNGGFFPGENANYLRFMETQDEDRISYKYDSFEKTMPMATAIFLAPGVPLLFNGQEVGFGRGMGAPGEPDLNDRRRGIIDWSFPGRSLLQPHYHRLVQIRKQFDAFSQHKMDTNGDGNVDGQDDPDFVRVGSSNGIVYAYMRPWLDANGVTVANFANSARTVTLDIAAGPLQFTGGFDPNATYWVNNLYADTSYQMLGSDLATVTVDLPAYGSAVYTIATEAQSLVLPPLPNITSIGAVAGQVAERFELRPNYPNPFNPETTIEFRIDVASELRLTIYNVLGQQVRTLAEGRYQAGAYRVRWDGRDDRGRQAASGIYLVTLRAGEKMETRRMVLMK